MEHEKKSKRFINVRHVYHKRSHLISIKLDIRAVNISAKTKAKRIDKNPTLYTVRVFFS